MLISKKYITKPFTIVVILLCFNCGSREGNLHNNKVVREITSKQKKFPEGKEQRYENNLVAPEIQIDTLFISDSLHRGRIVKMDTNFISKTPRIEMTVLLPAPSVDTMFMNVYLIERKERANMSFFVYENIGVISLKNPNEKFVYMPNIGDTLVYFKNEKHIEIRKVRLILPCKYYVDRYQNPEVGLLCGENDYSIETNYLGVLEKNVFSCRSDKMIEHEHIVLKYNHNSNYGFFNHKSIIDEYCKNLKTQIIYEYDENNKKYSYKIDFIGKTSTLQGSNNQVQMLEIYQMDNKKIIKVKIKTQEYIFFKYFLISSNNKLIHIYTSPIA